MFAPLRETPATAGAWVAENRPPEADAPAEVATRADAPMRRCGNGNHLAPIGRRCEECHAQHHSETRTACLLR
jgi:hypothetical protein